MYSGKIAVPPGGGGIVFSDRNASLYASENFDRRVRLRTSGTLLTSFIMAFRSRVIYDVLSYRCNYPKNEVSFN
jgi:hypothetical protein